MRGLNSPMVPMKAGRKTQEGSAWEGGTNIENLERRYKRAASLKCRTQSGARYPLVPNSKW
jgi:hypothetical protein